MIVKLAYFESLPTLSVLGYTILLILVNGLQSRFLLLTTNFVACVFKPEIAKDALTRTGLYSVVEGVISPVNDGYKKKVFVILVSGLEKVVETIAPIIHLDNYYSDFKGHVLLGLFWNENTWN